MKHVSGKDSNIKNLIVNPSLPAGHPVVKGESGGNTGGSYRKNIFGRAICLLFKITSLESGVK